MVGWAAGRGSLVRPGFVYLLGAEVVTNAKREIEVDQSPEGRWYWRVGNHSGEERSQDAAYDRARDVERSCRCHVCAQFHENVTSET